MILVDGMFSFVFKSTAAKVAKAAPREWPVITMFALGCAERRFCTDETTRVETASNASLKPLEPEHH